MDIFRIQGGKKLSGRVEISGSKNAALPIMCASLLTPESFRLKNLPDLQDVKFMGKILEHMGCGVNFGNSSCEVTAQNIKPEADYDLVRKMRASILVLGPTLARFGEAKVSLPGGCAIGARPVDMHLKGLEALGAKIEIEQGYVFATAKRLIGNKIELPFPSVGATENLLMAATLAKGETVITNAAREPEIIDLARCLKSMGALIEGEGSDEIRIQGKENLHGTEYTIMADRIEAATFLMIAAICGESMTLSPFDPWILQSVAEVLKEIGIEVIHNSDSVSIKKLHPFKSVNIATEPFPGFPTDVQAQLMTLLCLADGESVIEEKIFENRFMHVPELNRLGADIRISGRSALVKGGRKFVGAPVMATDLRASASLVMAALTAEGESLIHRVYHIDRGYEAIEKKLSALGAQITREKQ